MLINNPEALKSWLIVVLEPLCDADSSALARYVLALVKKEKPEKDLKRVMIEQLDVFLADETKTFVDRLFDAIANEEYLNFPTNVQQLPAVNRENDASVALIATTISNSDDVIKPIESNVESSTHTSNNKDSKSVVPMPHNIGVNSLTSSSLHLDAAHSNNIVYDVKTKEPHKNYNKTHEINAALKTSEMHLAHAPVINAQCVNSSNIVGCHNYNNHVRSASPPTRAIADKENQPRDNRRRRASLRSRSRSPRSRSRSNDRMSRRSRSRDRGRINEREKNRQFRNKSPPPNDLRHHISGSRRNFDDRRRRNAGGSNLQHGERSPRFANNKVRIHRSNSPRSRSPSSDRQRGCHAIRNSPERHHHLHHHNQLQVQQQPLTHESNEGILNEIRQRCRDFDEKGYCVRGETCPWDHGINPVVFEGINNSALISMSMREYNPDAPEIWARSSNNVPPSVPTQQAPSINPFTGNVRPNAMIGAHVPPVDYGRAPPGAPMVPFPFNPTAVTTPIQRQLVPIPVIDATGGVAPDTSKRRYELEDTVAIAEGPTKRKIPINSRLGPRVGGVASMQQNCALELRKVPRGLNTIAHLNNHFAKFGKIVNIQVSYEGDPEAAIITFSTHAEANVAYRSTEAVLNNRFIKVFWHSQDMNANNDAVGAAMIGGRKNSSQYHLNNVPAAMPTQNTDSAKTSNASQSSTAGNNLTESGNNTATTPTGTAAASDTTAAAIASPASLRLKHNLPVRGTANTAIIRKKQEEQAKAVVQLANGLRKRKQELLQTYVKQMKSVVDLVERLDHSDPQRAKTVETIKVLQETIDKLHKEIAEEQEQVQAQMKQQQSQQPLVKKTKEQQKKELLDIELELFAQQQEGNDTSAIQKRLEDLQRSLGITPSHNAAVQSVGNTAPNTKSTVFVAGGRSKPRPSFPEGSTRVDRRPKAIVVTGFAAEDADFVLGHFKNFGEITKHDVDREIPQLILSFATRSNAEKAVLHGKIFKDKRLQISWAPVVKANPPTNNTQVVADKSNIDAIALEKSKMETSKQILKSISESESIVGETLPELRLEDEEEEDECEDRSWRR